MFLLSPTTLFFPFSRRKICDNTDQRSDDDKHIYNWSHIWGVTVTAVFHSPVPNVPHLDVDTGLESSAEPEDGEGHHLLMGTINIPAMGQWCVSFCGSIMNNWKAPWYLIPQHEYSGCGIMGKLRAIFFSLDWIPAQHLVPPLGWSRLSSLHTQSHDLGQNHL